MKPITKWLIVVVIVVGLPLVFYRWLESDIAQPPPLSEKMHIQSAERRAWGDVANDINTITVVARGRFALVSTNIDSDNLELLEKRDGQWVRVTPNGWADNIDRITLMRAGVPFAEANALVNGMRYQWHRAGESPDPGPFRF